MTDVKIDDIVVGKMDSAGLDILSVYSKDPGNYAVYRTSDRVTIEFSDDPAMAREQRGAMAKLNPLRGEINGLIDGWRRSRNVKEKIKSGYFDRRVADALTVGLEGDVDSAFCALEAAKQDLIEDRTSWARFLYLLVGSGTAIILIALIGFAMSDWFAHNVAKLPEDTSSLWTAAAAGAVGAFFSIAIAIRNRTILTDLHMRDNVADSLLRILIGLIAATLLMCLLVSHAVHLSLGGADLAPDKGPYSWTLALVVGFISGFSERLVPDLLARSSVTALGGAAPAAPSAGDAAPGPAVKAASPPPPVSPPSPVSKPPISASAASAKPTAGAGSGAKTGLPTPTKGAGGADTVTSVAAATDVTSPPSADTTAKVQAADGKTAATTAAKSVQPAK